MFALKHGVIIVCVFPALHCNCFFFKLHFHPFQMKLTRAKKEHYYTVTLTFELNLDNIVLIQHAKYLDQRLLHLKVIQKFKSYWPYSQTVTHILPIALPGPLITEVIGKTACLCVFLAKFFSFCVFCVFCMIIVFITTLCICFVSTIPVTFFIVLLDVLFMTLLN